MIPFDSKANELLVCSLRGTGRQGELTADPDSIPDPYQRAGSHPDVVERLWDRLGASVPRAARCLVCGSPALIQPVTGVVLGICLGTQYALRLPDACGEAAAKAGLESTTRWSNGKVMDLSLAWGPGWWFGAWLAGEPDWVRQAFEFYGRHSGPVPRLD